MFELTALVFVILVCIVAVASPCYKYFYYLMENPKISDFECPDCGAMVELQENGEHILDGSIPVRECRIKECPFQIDLDEKVVYDD